MRRDRASIHRYRRLLDAAGDVVIVLGGVRAPAASDVARCAGVDLATFYRYFDSPASLLATLNSLRVGDTDRDRIIGFLRHHYTAGRLTVDEFGDRVEAAFQATTWAELGALFRDLPGIIDEPERKRRFPRRRAVRA